MNQIEANQLVNQEFERSGVPLFRYAYRRTGSSVLAEDLVQEAFLAFYRDLRSGKAIHDSTKWLFGTVRNQIYKQRRSNKHHEEQLVSPDKLDLLPAETLEVADQPDVTPELLALLTAREEEVILLRLQSWKYREIAAFLGIGSKSVCTLLSRAVRKLQSFSRVDREDAYERLKKREVRTASR